MNKNTGELLLILDIILTSIVEAIDVDPYKSNAKLESIFTSIHMIEGVLKQNVVWMTQYKLCVKLFSRKLFTNSIIHTMIHLGAK